MTKTTKQHTATPEAIALEIERLVGQLAIDSVEANLAMDEAKKLRRKEERTRRRLARAQAEAQALQSAAKESN